MNRLNSEDVNTLIEEFSSDPPPVEERVAADIARLDLLIERYAHEVRYGLWEQQHEARQRIVGLVANLCGWPTD